MKKSFVVLLHIGFWACYVIVIAIMLTVYYRSNLYASSHESRIMNAFKTICLFVLVPSFVSYFSYYYLLFPKYVQQKKYFLSLIYGILISAVAAVIGYILLRYFIETGSIRDMDKNGINGRSTAVRVIIITVSYTHLTLPTKRIV